LDLQTVAPIEDSSMVEDEDVVVSTEETSTVPLPLSPSTPLPTEESPSRNDKSLPFSLPCLPPSTPLPQPQFAKPAPMLAATTRSILPLEVVVEPMETELDSKSSLKEKKKMKNDRKQKSGLKKSTRGTSITKLKSPTHRSPRAKPQAATIASMIAKGRHMIEEQALNFTRTFMGEQADAITEGGIESHQDEDVYLWANNQDATTTTTTTTVTAVRTRAQVQAQAQQEAQAQAQTNDEEKVEVPELSVQEKNEEDKDEDEASNDSLNRFFDDSSTIPSLDTVYSQTSSRRSTRIKRKDPLDDTKETSARWIKELKSEEGKPRRRHRRNIIAD
jgi:hypothetical protein